MATVPRVDCAKSSHHQPLSNRCPPAGFFCAEGCGPCSCGGSGTGLQSCGSLCCAASPTPQDGSRPCYTPCPSVSRCPRNAPSPLLAGAWVVGRREGRACGADGRAACAQGLTSSGDGTGWDICYRPWGDTFLTALLVLAAVYAAVALAITRQPKLPDSHRQRLRELQGLVADGV